MSTTWSNSLTILNDVLTNTLDAADDLFTTIKHENIPSVFDLISTNLSDYADFEWEDDEGKVKPITKYSKGLLCTFKRFATWKMNEEGINIALDPKAINKLEFQNFWAGPINNDEVLKSSPSCFALITSAEKPLNAPMRILRN